MTSERSPAITFFFSRQQEKVLILSEDRTMLKASIMDLFIITIMDHMKCDIGKRVNCSQEPSEDYNPTLQSCMFSFFWYLT